MSVGRNIGDGDVVTLQRDASVVVRNVPPDRELPALGRSWRRLSKTGWIECSPTRIHSRLRDHAFENIP